MEASSHPLDRKSAANPPFPTDVVTLLYGLFIYASVIFLFNQSVFLRDPDTFLHIATGKGIIAEHGFPRQDVFSHTVLGQPWINMEWLSQIILFLSYHFF